MTTIDSLLAQLEQAVGAADLTTRYHVSNQLQKLARSVATPRQIMQDIGYRYTEQAIIRTAAELDIFTCLSEADRPLTTADIAKKHGADIALIDRILRHLASTSTVEEIGKSTFAANSVTHLFASPAGRGNILYGFDILNKAFQELPAFLRSISYQDPETASNTAFNQAYNTNEQFFPWFQRQTEALEFFHPSLTAFKSPVPWTTIVPLRDILENSSGSAPLFVDVGGGHGFQCAEFRRATKARFRGRVINQDLPQTLASAPQYEGIEMMEQNFYEENQVKGAKIFYIRNCLHDMTDSTAKVVLKHIKNAMAPESYLLIDEIVVPDLGASSFSMQLDATMLAFFNSRERTLPRWQSMLEELDLVIRKVYRYDPELEYSVLAVQLK